MSVPLRVEPAEGVWLDAPAAQIKALGGVLSSDGAFSVARFGTREQAERFATWLEARCYQALPIVAPNEQCESYVMSYR